MGLIKALAGTTGIGKAGVGALGGVLADQWKEFFYCDAIPADVLMVKGQKRTTNRSANTKGNDNIITNGSVIAVADGQCMIIVDQGQVVEVCAEPGEFTYDASTEPSIFTGNLKESIKDSFRTMGRRFTFGGDTAKDQRVYYFNTKEITDNKFGTANPIPFRVVDSRVGLDLDTSVRCNGVFSYRIADPIVFYTKLAGNVSGSYTRETIDSQLKTEFISALQPAFGELSNKEIRPNQLVAHTDEFEAAMNRALSVKWGELRGLEVVSVAIGSVTLPEEDQKFVQQAQRAAAFSNAGMGAGLSAIATADAMNTAAGNTSGAMTGFMGMGMAGNVAGNNMSNLYGIAAQQQQQQAAPQQPVQQQAAPIAAGWKCACGATAAGKFCTECGAPRPAEEGWTCTCGAVNKGKFCPNCGAKKPEGAPLYRCDKCGWQPEDPHNPPKFCPECGDVFDENDKA